ncbi:hypothetical protein GCM10027051_12540 [Niabella terrae]
MKPLLSYLLVALVTSLVLSCAGSRKSATDPEIEALIDQQEYTFAAQSVNPTEDSRYNPRLMFPNAANNLYQLSLGYDLRVSQDSVIAYLPFFGRSFTAPMNPSEGGIKFTSTDFSYKQSRKKGNFVIEIRPNDNRDVRDLYLTVSPSGYATLQVLQTNKTPISFYGRVQEH